MSFSNLGKSTTDQYLFICLFIYYFLSADKVMCFENMEVKLDSH